MEYVLPLIASLRPTTATGVGGSRVFEAGDLILRSTSTKGEGANVGPNIKKPTTGQGKGSGSAPALYYLYIFFL